MSPRIRPEILRTLRLLEDHYREPLTLEEVAQAVGYSRFHLAREFKAVVGQAPMQYLAAQRFRAARKLLLTDDAKVVDICMEVGFTSLGTFTRRFVEEVGVTPSAFRRLPEELGDDAPLPRHVPGNDPRGGRLSGTIVCSPEAYARVGPEPLIYLGLFTERAARGRPACGSVLAGPGPFLFTDIAPGRYWLLAAAFGEATPLSHLLEPLPVTGGVPHPVTVGHGLLEGQVVWMHPPEHWATPITVALPALTSAAAARPPIPLPRPPEPSGARPRD